MATVSYKLEVGGSGIEEVTLRRIVIPGVNDDPLNLCLKNAEWTNPQPWHPLRRNEMRLKDGYIGSVPSGDCFRCVTTNSTPDPGDTSPCTIGTFPNEIEVNDLTLSLLTGVTAWNAHWQTAIDYSCVPFSDIPTPQTYTTTIDADDCPVCTGPVRTANVGYIMELPWNVVSTCNGFEAAIEDEITANLTTPVLTSVTGLPQWLLNHLGTGGCYWATAPVAPDISFPFFPAAEPYGRADAYVAMRINGSAGSYSARAAVVLFASMTVAGQVIQPCGGSGKTGSAFIWVLFIADYQSGTFADLSSPVTLTLTPDCIGTVGDYTSTLANMYIVGTGVIPNQGQVRYPNIIPQFAFFPDLPTTIEIETP